MNTLGVHSYICRDEIFKKISSPFIYISISQSPYFSLYFSLYFLKQKLLKILKKSIHTIRNFSKFICDVYSITSITPYIIQYILYIKFLSYFLLKNCTKKCQIFTSKNAKISNKIFKEIYYG